MRPKDADGMANSVDPDHTGPSLPFLRYALLSGPTQFAYAERNN